MNKRWIYLFLGICANIAQGVSYSASVISTPLLLMVGIENKEDILRAHWATLFTLSIAFLPLGMIIAGYLTDKKGPRFSIALGGLVYACALLFASFASNYWVLCLTFGLMLSLGSGLAYGPIVASAVRWFPDKRGLASGLVIGALGFGPVLIAPLCQGMLENNYSISLILRILGGTALIAIGFASFITSPPPEFANKVSSAPKKEVKKSQPLNIRPDCHWSKMIQTPNFWFLFFLLFMGTAPGLMLISAAKKIFELQGGFSPATATMMVMLIAVANALGRILWGWISDHFGRTNTLSTMFACSSLAMITLALTSNTQLMVLAVFIVGTTYGGYLGLFPAFCADSFGLKNLSLNYAILFIAFAVAAIIGPRLYAILPDPKTAFYVVATLATIGLVSSLVLKRQMRKSG